MASLTQNSLLLVEPTSSSSSSSSRYPSYDDDEELFAQFIRHHTILVRDDGSIKYGNEDHEDEDDMIIPTAAIEENEDDDDDDGRTSRHYSIRKINCYQSLLHRIRHRQYYTSDELSSSSSSSSATSSHHTFVIEIPCSEMIRYNPNLYYDFVHHRILPNVLRYQDIFCTVLDRLLSQIPLTNHNNDTTPGNASTTTTTTVPPRSVDDILYDQRLTLQQQQQQLARTVPPPPLDNGTTPNPYNGGGPPRNPALVGPMEEEEEEEQQQQQQRTNAMMNPNITADFPPLLMRRYELRILPVGRQGIYPPFSHQYHSSPSSTQQQSSLISMDKTNPTTTDMTNTTTSIIPTSIRNVRAQSIGRLVTITGMIVRVSDVKPILQVAAYACDYCGAEIYQTLQYQKEFLPATHCPLCMVPPQPLAPPIPGDNDGDVPPRQRRRNIQQSKGNTLFLQTRGSKFVKYQELKVQELSHHVPMGHVPRSITVLAYGECTRQGTPGDIVTIDGIYLPQKIGGESGYQAMKAGLITTTFLQAQYILVHKKSYDHPDENNHNRNQTTASSSLSSSNPNNDHHGNNTDPPDINESIRNIAYGPDPIGRLSSSIAPEIFGHTDIKRALLLQLVSGCTRTLPDGMRIRGDINILLMGDPGVAKSQLLKHVATIAPRGVYTTGKGSSGVGLTAAVTRDTTTNEMTLEGGALVFADRGICCIDEFDKMDESDRTAIHEVMEQQTVSIAKAGIVATLNARTSVLAAANPIYGRYNPYKSLSDNIALPNSLLSRFDLIFLILDIADMDKDMALAKHVTLVHQMEGQKQYELQNGVVPLEPSSAIAPNNDDVDNENEHSSSDPTTNDPTVTEPPVSSLILREYITRARQYHPVVPPDVAPYIVEAYVSLRMQSPSSQGGTHRSRRGGGNNSNSSSSSSNDQTVMTARQLLSTLRLSQAIARLRFSNVVAREDVDEAIRLTHMSKANLYTMQDNHRSNSNNNRTGVGGRNNNNNESTDSISKIFHILRDYCTVTKQSHMDLQLCEAMTLRKGYTKQQLHECLTEYESLDILQFNQTKTQIHFI